MRGVNLELFDFDYDLTWFAFFINGDERVLGRFGGRLPDDSEKYKNLDGLRLALIDTAGIREAADEVEREGVARARRTWTGGPTSSSRTMPRRC